MQSPAQNKRRFIFPALVAAALVIFGLYNLYFSSVSKHWPNTIGIITKSSVVVSSGRGHFWQAYLRYQYQVNEVQHSCDTYRFGGGSYFSRHSAEIVVAQYVPGDQVKVFYDPNNPSRAVLAPGMNFAGWLASIFFVSWLAALVYFLKKLFTTSNRADTSFENAKNTTLPV